MFQVFRICLFVTVPGVKLALCHGPGHRLHRRLNDEEEWNRSRVRALAYSNLSTCTGLNTLLWAKYWFYGLFQKRTWLNNKNKILGSKDIVFDENFNTNENLIIYLLRIKRGMTNKRSWVLHCKHIENHWLKYEAESFNKQC